MTMEKYNWIKAYYASQNDDCEHEVFVKQEESCSEYFVSDKGTRFHISELDLTQGGVELIPVDKSDGLKWLMQSMDANAIADHKAKIDESEYWRKLRGDIFASLRKDYHSDLDALNQTEFIIKRLYEQDKEFFKDK